MGRLLQRCAALLESFDAALTEEMGGQAARLELTLAVRDRCVALGSKLGARFNSGSALKAMTDDGTRRLQKANAALASSSGSLDEAIDADGERAALACEATLDGMCALLRGVTQWDAYMKGRTEGGGGGSAGGSGASSSAGGVSSGGGGGGGGAGVGEALRHAPPFSEMARSAISLGHFWAYAAIGRAVRTPDAAGAEGTGAVATSTEADEVGGGDGSSSGLTEKVDSAFYVLQTSLRRAAHTCDAGISTAAVKHACALLVKLVLAHLQGQLKLASSISSKAQSLLAGAALAGVSQMSTSAAEGGGRASKVAAQAGMAVSAAAGKSQLGLLRTLSALHLCVSYTPRLWKAAADDFARSLPPHALGGTTAQLSDADSVREAFEAALEGGLKQLSSSLLPRLHKRLEAFSAASYTLQTEAAFAAAEGDTFVAGLMAELESAVRPLSPTLADGAKEALLQVLIAACAERLEELLFAKRFDQLGALQFDRDVRALTKRLGELTSRSVRELIARLTQMCTLLNLESEAECAELWAEGGWRVSAIEAKRVLALRVDFNTDRINYLALAEDRGVPSRS